MNKIYKIIRIITVAPILAFVMTVLIWKYRNGVFPTVWHLTYCLFFLGILPLLAYPLQKYIPAYKNKGREGQRNLAILFAVMGFAAGCVFSFLFPSSNGLKVIFVEYCCGALAILIVNKIFHIRISGHACGVFAPIALFIYFRLYAAVIVYTILAVLVFLASIKTKRHTFYQLIGGGIVPLVSIAIIMHL